ncbi:MAG: sigma-70 family RNA polymerase sigma factor [Opitutaceae bacterium]|nr:sigma-70 family RNA polymerase sigma factor [Cytophagales bacterium]
MEESKILELIRQGKDKEVIPLIYKKVLPQLKNYIVKNNGNREDAYDVFHDSLIIFYEQVIKQEFDTKYNIYGYLYKIAVFRWINKVKKLKSFVFTEEVPDLKSEESNFENRVNVNLTDTNLLDSLFSPIGEKCIELLSYTIYSDMNMEDIMLRMEFSSVEAVRMQHMRCKQKLIKEIQNNPSLMKKLKGI